MPVTRAVCIIPQRGRNHEISIIHYMGAHVRLRDDTRITAGYQNGSDLMNPDNQEFQMVRNPAYVSGFERFAISLVFFAVGLVIGFVAFDVLLGDAK